MSSCDESNIKKNYIVQSAADFDVLSACTAFYTNNIYNCTGGTLTLHSDIVSANTINASVYLSGGTNLLDILVSLDNFTTGATLIGSTAYFDRTNSLSAYTLDLSSLDISDTYITAFTYDNANTFTISDNSGTTFNATINIVTGLTVNGGLSATTVSACTGIYTSNLYGCSPITIHDSVQSITSSATGTTSFAFGEDNNAHGRFSFAINRLNTSSGLASFASGRRSIASGSYSHSIGVDTKATATASYAEGSNTVASGSSAHAEGESTIAGSGHAHAEGNLTIAIGESSHSEGEGTTASGIASHAEGYYNLAIGNASHAEGGHDGSPMSNPTSATTHSAHAEGMGTLASGIASHAEGKATIAGGDYSHAEGWGTNAGGDYSHAEGWSTTASHWAAHSEGQSTEATKETAHSEGDNTIADGWASHSQGKYTQALGDHSHSGGKGFLASAPQIVAYGNTSFIHFEQTSASGYIGAYGDYSAILGGNDHNIGTGSTSSGIFAGSGNTIDDDVLRSVVLGGYDITGITNDTVYVPNLNIGTAPIDNSLSQIIARGSDGTIKYRDVNSIISAATSADTYVTGFTYDNANTFTISDNSGSTFNATINTVTGLTSNGDIEVIGDVIVTGGTGNVSSKQFYVEGNLGLDWDFGSNSVTLGNVSDGTIINGTSLTVNSDTTINGNLSATTISATTYFGDGSNLTGIPHTTDTFVSGGTYNDITDIITFTNNTGGTFNVTGITDTFVTGFTWNPTTFDLTIEQNNGVIDETVNLSVLASDVYVLSGTYNPTTGIVTYTNSTGGTFQVSGFTTGMTDSYTTDAYISGTEIKFDNNIQGVDYYNVDLLPLLSGKTDVSLFNSYTSDTQTVLDSKVSGATNLSSTGIFAQKNGENLEFKGLTSTGGTVTITNDSTIVNIEIPIDTNTFVTGFTYDDINTFTITRNDGTAFTQTINVLSATTISGGTLYGDGSNLTGVGGTFTGNTSATCITDLWVTNISGCSPVTIGTEAIFNQDVSGATSIWTTPNPGGGAVNLMTPALTIRQQGSSQNFSGPAIRFHNTNANENAYIYYQDGGSGAYNGNAFNFISDGGFNFEGSGNLGGDGFFRVAKGQSSFIIDDNGSAPRTDIRINNGNGGTAYSRLGLGATGDYWYFEADDVNTPMHIGWDDGVTEKNVFIFTTSAGTIDTNITITSGFTLSQTPTLNNSGTDILIRNSSTGDVEYRDITSITADTNTTITGFTYDDSNTFTISDSDGSNYSASINIMTGLTINGESTGTTLTVNGQSVFSGSSTDVVQIYGSGSTTPIFRIQGSAGELFSVTDSLVGELFAVNDISGIPILQVHSDNRIILGDNLAPSLYTTAKVTASSGSSTSIYSVPVSAYTGAWFEYTANDGTSLRAGNIASIFTASDVNHNETTTTDIGNTSDLIMDVSVSGGNATLTASATTSNWEIKTIIRSI